MEQSSTIRTNFGQKENKLASASLDILNRLKAFNHELSSLIIKSKNKAMLISLLLEAEKLIEKFNQAINMLYLHVLTDNLDNDPQEIENISEALQNFQEDIKSSQNREELFYIMIKRIKYLSNKCKKQFQSKSICKLIQRKIEEIQEYLPTKDIFHYLLSQFQFQSRKYGRSMEEVKYDSLNSFTKYLQKLKINLKQPLKLQFHNNLLEKYSIIGTFEGQKTIQGSFFHKDKYFHEFNLPIQVQVPFSRVLAYSKQIQLKGTKKYSGVKNVPRCSVKRWSIPLNIPFFYQIETCIFCSNRPIQVIYAGTQEYDIRFEKKGVVPYEKTQVIQTNANFTKMKEYQININYRKNVNFTKDFETICDNHHQCSCKELAQIAFSARKIFEDIKYYNSLLIFQRRMAEMMNKRMKDSWQAQARVLKRQLEILQTPNEQTPTPFEKESTPNAHQKASTPNDQTPNDEEQTPTPQGPSKPQPSIQRPTKIKDRIDQCEKILSKFNLQGYNIVSQGLTLHILSQQIHSYLTEATHFSFPIKGKTCIQIQQQYQHQIHFQGGEYFSGSLQHNGQVYYQDEYVYNATIPYKGKVRALSCYEDCWLCKCKSIEVDYQGEVELKRKGTYSGIVPFHQVKKWEKYVPYSETVAFTGKVKKDLEVNYTDNCEVTCEKDARLGFGHHNCTSCALWETFVTSFIALLQQKDQLITKITKNKTLISKVHQQEFNY